MSKLPRGLLSHLVPVIAIGVGVVLLATGSLLGALPVAFGLVSFTPLGDTVRSVVERGASALAHVVSTVALALVHIVVILPVWAVHRLAGVDALGAGVGWSSDARRDATGDPDRLFRPLRASRVRRTARHRLRIAASLAAVALVGNYGAGWAWDALAGTGGAVPATEIPIRIVEQPLALPSSTTEPEFVSGTIPVDDSRISGPLWRDVPWAAEYFWDFNAHSRMLYPFIGTKPKPWRTEYINIDGWERRSYEPSSTEGAPVIWFFGGSTTFGFGQRDEHTIPSEIARIAEEEGTPVVVRNFGQSVWVNWQEMLLFEQLLATEPTPQFAVFYDGLNDVNNQILRATDVPADQFFNQSDPRNPPDPDLAFEPTADADVQQLVARVVDIYGRGRRMIDLMSADRGVAVSYFWQPQALVDSPSFIEAARRVEHPVVDLTHVLDDHNVYFDAQHTNEEGARLVAEAQWETLGPRIAAWYEGDR